MIADLMTDVDDFLINPSLSPEPKLSAVTRAHIMKLCNYTDPWFDTIINWLETVRRAIMASNKVPYRPTEPWLSPPAVFLNQKNRMRHGWPNVQVIYAGRTRTTEKFGIYCMSTWSTADYMPHYPPTMPDIRTHYFRLEQDNELESLAQAFLKIQNERDTL